MGEGNSIGKIYVELDLDPSRYLKGQQQLYKSATSTSLNIEQNFKNLGIKSDAIFDLMRMSAENSYNMIKNHAGSSTAEIARAHAAMNAKIESANKEQFGTHESMLSKFKANWMAVTAAVTAAIMIMRKAWNLAEQAAEYEEMKVGLNALSMQYNVTATSMIQMTKAASGMQLSMKQAGEMSARALATGLNPQQIVTFTEQAEKLTDTIGGKMTDAFKAMEEAAGSGRARGLQQYKIYVDLKEVVNEYAAKHNMLAKDIDQTTLVQIRANAIMDAAKGKIDQMGPSIDSTADKMNRMKAAFEDAQLMVGQIIPRIAAGIAGVFYEIGAATTWMVGKMAEELGRWVDTLDKVTFGKIKFLGDAKKWTAEFAASELSQARISQQKANDSFSVMIASTKDLATTQTTQGKPAMDAYTGSVDKLGKKVKEVEEDKLKLIYAAIDEASKARKEKEEASERMLDKFFKDEEARKEREIKNARETSEELMRISRERLEAIKKDEDYHYQARTEQYQIFQDFMNKAGGGELAGNLSFLASASKGEDQYTQEIERANQHYVDMLALNQGYWDATTRNAEAAAERDAQIKQSTTNRTLTTTSSAFGAMAGMAKAYYAASGNESSKAYKLYKTFSKAQIVVDTAKAAIGAYQAMAGIPYIGPVLGVIAAAAAIMYGKAQMDAVDAAEPGGSGSISAGGGGASYSAGSSTMPDTTTIPKEDQKKEEKKPPEVHVYFYGDVLDHDKLARDLIPGINKAYADKVQ